MGRCSECGTTDRSLHMIESRPRPPLNLMLHCCKIDTHRSQHDVCAVCGRHHIPSFLIWTLCAIASVCWGDHVASRLHLSTICMLHDTTRTHIHSQPDECMCTCIMMQFAGILRQAKRSTQGNDSNRIDCRSAPCTDAARVLAQIRSSRADGRPEVSIPSVEFWRA